MNNTEIILAAAYDDHSWEPRDNSGKWTKEGARHSGAYQNRKDAPRKNGQFAPKPKPRHDQLVRNEVAQFDHNRKMKIYRTAELEHIARAHSKIYRVPLTKLLDEEGKIPGSSVEPDNTKKFKNKVKGLDLNAYFQGKYPPVLMIKQGGDLRIINGRHRTVNFKNKLEEAGHNINSPKAAIRARVLDLDNPKIYNLVKKTIHMNTEHNIINAADLQNAP
jgi:hypothetical protein